ncbi:uncharacterized protein B0H18DRAFT_968314, partial [Fomitopsis serialis]|uniref:uncharacterized protein n=1 Tax=Fomitopsis serialis TaxID=139415 RepID=UPI002008B204
MLVVVVRLVPVLFKFVLLHVTPASPSPSLCMSWPTCLPARMPAYAFVGRVCVHRVFAHRAHGRRWTCALLPAACPLSRPLALPPIHLLAHPIARPRVPTCPPSRPPAHWLRVRSSAVSACWAFARCARGRRAHRASWRHGDC